MPKTIFCAGKYNEIISNVIFDFWNTYINTVIFSLFSSLIEAELTIAGVLLLINKKHKYLFIPPVIYLLLIEARIFQRIDFMNRNPGMERSMEKVLHWYS